MLFAVLPRGVLLQAANEQHATMRADFVDDDGDERLRAKRARFASPRSASPARQSRKLARRGQRTTTLKFTQLLDAMAAAAMHAPVAAPPPARARDGTVYGRSRTSAKSFFKHHTQQLAAAAQVGDAKAIRRADCTREDEPYEGNSSRRWAGLSRPAQCNVSRG